MTEYQNYVVLVEGREPIAAYDNEYKGKRYFHIRKMYEQHGEYLPGKGLAVPYDQRDQLLAALRGLR